MKRKDVVIIAVLFAVSFLIRLFFINDGLFHHDSLQMTSIIEAMHEQGFSVLFDDRFFLLRSGVVIINYLLWNFFLLFGVSAAFVTNFSSVLFGGLAVVVLYLFTLRFMNRKIAVIASVLFSFSPLALSVSTYGKEHMAQLFFILLSFWLLLEAGKRVSLVFLSGLSMGIAFLMRESTFLYLPLFILLMWHQRKSYTREQWAAILIPLVVLFILQLSLGLWGRAVYALQSLFGTPDPSVGHLVFDWGLFSFASSSLALGLGVLIIPFVLYGIFLLYKEKKIFSLVFLLFWSLIFGYFSLNSIFSPRWLVELLPAFFILGGIGLVKVYDWKKEVCMFFVIAMVITSFILIYPVLEYRAEYSALKEVSLFIDEHTFADAEVIYDEDLCYHLDYYSDVGCIGNNLIDKYKLLDLVDIIKDKVDAGVPLYVVYNHKRVMREENTEMFFRYLDDEYDLEKKGTTEWEDFHKNALTLDVSNVTLVRIHQKVIVEQPPLVDLLEQEN